MENTTLADVTASQPGNHAVISMLMTDACIDASSFVRSNDSSARGGRSLARSMELPVEKSAQMRSARDPRKGSATSVISLEPAFISPFVGVTPDYAATDYGPVRFQEHPPAA
jgi:hypothetical protein